MKTLYNRFFWFPILSLSLLSPIVIIGQSWCPFSGTGTSWGTVVCLNSQEEVNQFEAPTNGVFEGILVISGSDIVDLSPLSELTEVIGLIVIQYNPNLQSLHGLANIKSIRFAEGITVSECGIMIENNQNLSTLMGLHNLELVEDQFSIRFNPQLGDLDGLQGLSELTGTLSIDNLTTLASLDGLTGLRKVFSLQVTNNSALQTLHGLSAMSDIYRISIINNPLLSNCAISAICMAPDIITYIGDNSTGCNTIEEILDDCATDYNDAIRIITDLNLPDGISEALTGKIANAQIACDAGNEKETDNVLSAFIHQVEAQRGKNITTEQADQLIALAEELKAIDCSLPSMPAPIPPGTLLQESFIAFPNPTSGLIHLSQSGKKVTIYNSIGQRIKIINNSPSIDLTDQRPGIYLLEIEGNVINIVKH